MLSVGAQKKRTPILHVYRTPFTDTQDPFAFYTITTFDTTDNTHSLHIHYDSPSVTILRFQNTHKKKNQDQTESEKSSGMQYVCRIAIIIHLVEKIPKATRQILLPSTLDDNNTTSRQHFVVSTRLFFIYWIMC